MSLSARDCVQVSELATLLVSPLRYGRSEEWAAAVNASAQRVLEADATSFMVPVEGRMRLFSDQFGAVGDEYPERLRPVDGRFDLWHRQLEMTVWDRRTLYGRHWDAILRSGYWNDYVVKIRAFDAIGITVEVGPTGQLAGLMYHHHHPTRRRFSGRELSILRLLLPSFQAGLEGCLRMSQWTAELGRVVDEIGEAVLLTDTEGREVHRTRALRALLEAEPDDGLARRLTEIGRGVLARPRAVGGGGRRHVTWRGRLGEYVLSGVLASADLAPWPMALVVVRPRHRPSASTDALRTRFGLTAQEGRIAGLLASRRTNREIAGLLSISEHTARHHTESVLRKLGVTSRRHVIGVITSSSTQPCGGEPA